LLVSVAEYVTIYLIGCHFTDWGRVKLKRHSIVHSLVSVNKKLSYKIAWLLS